MMIRTKAMQDDADSSELLDSMQIIKIERRHLAAGGAWVVGTMGEHRFEALVFPEHAECDCYELGNSRISKLHIRRIADRVTVFNWDRGADIEPVTPRAAQIAGLLEAGLAETVFGK